jgi:hypothetical protein
VECASPLNGSPVAVEGWGRAIHHMVSSPEGSMKAPHFPPASALAALVALALAPSARATDVDGSDDCQRFLNDFGDAPEAFDAYPGVVGRFPTCLFVSPPGTQTGACVPISTPPGATGFVLHTSPPNGYWLGCAPVGVPPLGIDSEIDGKTSPGLALSTCAQIPVDCIEPTAVGVFGQDECFGSDDAGLTVLPALGPCELGAVEFRAHNCGPTREVVLNVLLDMNMDGDWNDSFDCPIGCAYEWGLKNVVIALPPGCTTIVTPPFLVGPNVGAGWLRISISDNIATDDYPWAGSANSPGQAMFGGETEDYVVEITHVDPCEEELQDFGDAPESIPAYPTGLAGNFPTCLFPGGIATLDLDPACPFGAVPPGPAGYVEHFKPAADPNAFWLGCTPVDPTFIDSERDGKVNNVPFAPAPSSCNPNIVTDCVEIAPFGPGLDFGQDECLFDGVDAGLVTPPLFERCGNAPLELMLFNCLPDPINVFVNVLVDLNEDGDWTDVHNCVHVQRCAPEWAIVNMPVVLGPGCNLWLSPGIQVGPFEGFGWMRVTVSEQPAPPDFPWNGTVTLPGGRFAAGETEDYPVVIQPSAIGVGEIGERAEGLWLAGIAPNPSSSTSTVRFGLTRNGPVRLAVYDVTGRRVRTLVDGERAAGAHSVAWDLRSDAGEDVAPGIYLVRLEAEGRAMTSRVTRIR